MTDEVDLEKAAVWAEMIVNEKKLAWNEAVENAMKMLEEHFDNVRDEMAKLKFPESRTKQ